MRWLLCILLGTALLVLFFPKIASTPWGKQALVKILQAKTGNEIAAQSVRLSWFGPQSMQNVRLLGPDIDASCEELTAYMPLWKLPHLRGPFAVAEARISFPKSTSGSIERMNAKMENGQFSAEGATRQGKQNGTFSLSGSLADFPSTFSLQGRLSTMPSALCDELFQTNGFCREILGDWFSLSGTIESTKRQGSLTCSLSSAQCQTQVNGSFDGRSFSLKQPANISLLLTPSLSNRFLQDLAPLFLQAAYSSRPILIHLDPENFSLPYAPFDLASLTIAKGLIDLGKITIENGPALQTTLKFLRNSRLQESRKIEAWFAPFSFQLQKNSIKLGRLDLLLARSLHLCTWGKVNLSTKALHMYLGIPASALAASFHIPNLPSDFVLKIPIRGTISQPELITGPAIAQISALSVSQNLPKPGDALGKVFETVIKIKNDKDIPPPHRPFPWES